MDILECTDLSDTQRTLIKAIELIRNTSDDDLENIGRRMSEFYGVGEGLAISHDIEEAANSLYHGTKL